MEISSVDSLIESDALTITDDNRVTTTGTFESKAQDYEEELGVLDVTARAEEVLGFSISDDIGRNCLRRFLATVRAIRDFVEMEEERLLRVSTVVDQLRPSPPPDSGAPDSFFPIHGDRLPLLLDIHTKAVVYVWRECCEPCDIVRKDLDHLLTQPPANLSLFAVYGPNSPDLLKERYDVVGAPTVLFVIDGSTDMRLQGAYPTNSLESAINTYTDMMDG